ncbi:MAG: hypothetical protein Q7V88_11285 [Actinomycetota bacterium]|nr:hypothetical protein [Actinomycetota bacterium]
MAGALTALAAVLLYQLHWIGGDAPGSMLRVEMFRQGHYWRIPAWFGGFPNVTYSFLLPPIGAFFGVPATVCGAAGIATAAVSRLSEGVSRLRHVVGTAAFGLAMVATVANGRVPFAMGTAFAAWSLFWLRRNTVTGNTVAAVLALGAGLCSPVAGLFLAMLAAGVLLQHLTLRRFLLLGVFGACGVGPSFVANLYFRTGGGLPCSWATALTVAGVFVLFVVGANSMAVRISAGIGILACLMVGAFDTPLTYIIKRLPETAGGAAAAATLTKKLAVPLIAFMCIWNVLSIRTAAIEREPERSGAVYAPLLAEFHELQPAGIIEVVPTNLHWETYYVASSFPIARGWERQADIDHGALFYTGLPITAEQYREWLVAMKVEYVVLGTMPGDETAAHEKALLQQPPEYLTEVWSDGTWTIWRFDGFAAP